MAIFFSQRKPRGFNYKPRYYDPAAEEREERKKIVLGEKYRSPAQRARDAAEAAGESVPAEEYVPGSYLREHVAARRGLHAADTMRKRRRKTLSVPVLAAMLALIVLIVWMLYFK
ncbi:MAG: hypothetical protein LBU98_05720 [Alistipes sp.]|jgi:hypothetical protein|nr:hypothetical protein [Alistipes sp.]